MLMKKGNIKQRIINVSVKLFANNGFAGTSIRDIAKAASTNIPNIYYYFSSKEDLYKYILRDAMNKFAASIYEVKNFTSIREQLIAMGKSKYSFIQQNPDIMRLFFRERIGSKSGFKLVKEIGPILSSSISMMAGIIKRGIASGEFRKVDPELAARFLLGIFNAYDMEMVSMERVPSDKEIEAIVGLALESINRK